MYRYQTGSIQGSEDKPPQGKVSWNNKGAPHAQQHLEFRCQLLGYIELFMDTTTVGRTFKDITLGESRPVYDADSIKFQPQKVEQIESGSTASRRVSQSVFNTHWKSLRPEPLSSWLRMEVSGTNMPEVRSSVNSKHVSVPEMGSMDLDHGELWKWQYGVENKFPSSLLVGGLMMKQIRYGDWRMLLIGQSQQRNRLCIRTVD